VAKLRNPPSARGRSALAIFVSSCLERRPAHLARRQRSLATRPHAWHHRQAYRLLLAHGDDARASQEAITARLTQCPCAWFLAGSRRTSWKSARAARYRAPLANNCRETGRPTTWRQLGLFRPR